jgi:cysteine desulfuration protein SufE
MLPADPAPTLSRIKIPQQAPSTPHGTPQTTTLTASTVKPSTMWPPLWLTPSLNKRNNSQLTMTINQLQDEIIAEMTELDDWMDRYSYIIDLGNSLPAIDEQYKTPQNLIEGCQSRVWLNAELTADGLLKFTADSDAIIVKGIISMLIQVLSGHTPQEVLDADLYFIDRIGLSEHLSPTRSNGLLAMVKQIRMYALAFKELQSQNK